jgi:hypothetical protein
MFLTHKLKPTRLASKGKAASDSFGAFIKLAIKLLPLGLTQLLDFVGLSVPQNQIS